MIMSPKKKLATVILSKMSAVKKDEDKDDSSDFVQKIGEVDETVVEVNPAEKDNSIALESAAEDMMSAIKSENPKMLVEAIMNLIDLIQDDSDE